MSDSSLLGCPPSPLGLRIRGTERNGQTVWLSSPKVTIGSDRRSTLRLRAPGVAPVHCFLLRGSQHLIARRWSPDTRHNGSAFDEALLAAGDQLSIGPVEFEIVENKTVEKRTPEVSAPFESQADTPASPLALTNTQPGETAANNDSTANPAVNDKSLRSVRRLSLQLKVAHRQARRRVNKLTQQLRAARLQITELEQQLHHAGTEASFQKQYQAQWDQQRQTIDESRQQWLQTQSHLDRLFADLNQRLDAEYQAAQQLPAMGTAANQLSAASDAAQQELASLREKLETQQRDWERQRDACEAQLAQRQTALQQETDQLAKLQTTLDHQQSTLDQQVASLTERQKQLETQAIDLRRQQQVIEQQQAAHQTEVASFRQEQARLSHGNDVVEQQRREFEEQHAQLAEQTAQLQREREKLEQDQQQLTTLHEQLASERQSLNDERQSLAQQQQNLLHEQESLAAQQQALAASQQSFAERQAHIAAIEQELQQTKNELIQTRDELQAEIARMQASVETPLVAEASPAHPSPEIEEPSPPAPEQPADESDDVFARLRALAILKSDAAEENRSSKQTPQLSLQAEPIASTEQPASLPVQIADMPPAPAASKPNHEEEESIDDYMARLLQRVRSGTDSSKPKADATPREIAEAAKKIAAESEFGPVKPALPQGSSTESLKDLEPRTAAPEKIRDLAAMREIANLSTRHAIAKHLDDRKSHVVTKRMMIGIVGLFCGLVLVVTAPTTHSRSCYSGIAAIAISLFWIVPALWRAWKPKNPNQNKSQLATLELESAKFAQQPQDCDPSSAQDRHTAD